MFTYVLLGLLILIICWYFNIFGFIFRGESLDNTPSPIRLQRWRASVPNNNALGGQDTLRQVQDDWWDRAYNSGQGFQLG